MEAHTEHLSKCAGSPRTAVPRCQPYSVRPEQRFLVLYSVITKTVVRLTTAQIVAKKSMFSYTYYYKVKTKTVSKR